MGISCKNIMNNNRVLDRQNYSSKTLSLFSIISGYVVDIYYNHLYNEAKKFKASGHVPSVTEGYRHALFGFYSNINKQHKNYNPKHYETLLVEINKHFNTFMQYQTLRECIRNIAVEFLPEEYQDNIGNERCRAIVQNVLGNSIKSFTSFIATEFIGRVIDAHGSKENIIILKEKMEDLLLLEREKYFSKLVACETGTINEKVDMSFVNQLRNEVKKQVIEKQQIQTELVETQNKLQIQTQNAQLVIGKYRQLDKKFKLLVAEYKSLDDKYKNLVKKYNILQDDYDNQNTTVVVSDHETFSDHETQNLTDTLDNINNETQEQALLDQYTTRTEEHNTTDNTTDNTTTAVDNTTDNVTDNTTTAVDNAVDNAVDTTDNTTVDTNDIIVETQELEIQEPINTFEMGDEPNIFDQY